MFLDTLIQAGWILTHWRFWAVTLCCGFMGLLPLALPLPGLFFHVVLLSVWRTAVLAIAVVLLLPILFGIENRIGLHLLGKLTLIQFIWIGGLGLLAQLLVGIIPIVGTQSLSSFAEVSVMIAVALRMVGIEDLDLMPGFWMAIALALCAGVIANALGFLVAGIIAAVARGEETAGVFIAPMTAALSTVPASFYAAWLQVANSG
jgi:hypothetical protein